MFPAKLSQTTQVSMFPEQKGFDRTLFLVCDLRISPSTFSRVYGRQAQADFFVTVSYRGSYVCHPLTWGSWGLSLRRTKDHVRLGRRGIPREVIRSPARRWRVETCGHLTRALSDRLGTSSSTPDFGSDESEDTFVQHGRGPWLSGEKVPTIPNRRQV